MPVKRKNPPKPKKTTKKVGRPTVYDKKYCAAMLKFFNIPHTRKEVVTKFYKGKAFEQEVTRPNSLPTFEKFAVKIGVHRDTLHEWCEKHPEFSDAYKKAKEYQKDMLIDLGLLGFYNPAFTIFTAKNITDMKDKTEVETTAINEELSNEEREAVRAITKERSGKTG